MAVRSTPASKSNWQRYLPWLLLVGTLALAVFLRFYKLNSLPPGLHPDEAANGLDIFRMLDHHDFRVVYNTNGPREALFFYFQAIFVKLLGNTITALRIAPAIFGSLAVLMTYLWARDWFGRRVGLVAAFVMAALPWAIQLSRDGFRASMVPVVLATTAYCAGKAYHTEKSKWFVLAGLVSGIGFYTYVAWQLFIGIALGSLFFIALMRRKWLKRSWHRITLGLVAFALIIASMVGFAVLHPHDTTFSRAGGTSVLNRGLNGGSPLKTLADSAAKTILMFNIHGDDNYRHNLGGTPMLNVFLGVMFILGLLLALTQVKRMKYLMLLLIWGAMLLPGVLTAEGIPHALRTIGAIGPTVILVALGVDYMLRRWYQTFPINHVARLVGLWLLVVLLGLSAYQGYRQYFVAWAQDPKTYQAFSEDMVSLGNYLNAQHSTDLNGNNASALVLGEYSTKTVEYLTHYHSSYTRVEPGDLIDLPLNPKPHRLIWANNNDKDAIASTVRTKFPSGNLGIIYSQFNHAELDYVYETK